MSHVLVIAAREIRERKLVFAAAALMAVLSALAPLIPGTHNYVRGDVLILGGAASAVAYAAGLAIAFGGGIVGRDLRTGRMSFYFSKPVSASAIWFGKVIGALTTIAVAAVIIMIPALTLGGSAWQMRIDQPVRLLALISGATVLVFLVSHVVSTLIASRSPLVLADLAILLVLFGILWIIIRPLAQARAGDSVTHIIVGVLAALVLVILGAGTRQLSRGRTDAKRNHFELSRVVWPLMFVAVLVAAGYSKWVRTLTPQNFGWYHLMQSPTGDWLTLSGVRRYTDYYGSLLMNVQTGSFDQLAGRDPRFSRDGRTVAWLQPDQPNRYRVVTMTTDARSPRDTGIVVWGTAKVALSDDGARIAVIDGTTLSVHDITTRTLVGSVRLQTSPYFRETRLFFAEPDRVRVYMTERFTDGTMSLQALEFQPSQRAVQLTGVMRLEANSLSLYADPGGSRMLIRASWEDSPGNIASGRKPRHQLLDAVTLQPILASLPGGAMPSFSALFLSDGSLAIVEKEGARWVLRLVSSSGALVREFPLVSNGSALLASEVPNGRVLVSIGRGPIEKRTYSAEVINLADGKVERRETNVHPMLPYFSQNVDPRAMAMNPDRPSILVERDPNSEEDWPSIWRWNPSTGERTPLVKR